MYKDKKISVAMATYNGEIYITKQLQSIISQTVLPDEIIICDDNSNDETYKILNMFKIVASKLGIVFKIVINEKKLGFVKNFEKAILLCSGDYIFLCDQDDAWELSKIQEVIDIFCEYPETELIIHDADQIDSLGNYLAEEQFFRGVKLDNIGDNTALINTKVSLSNVISGPIAAGMCMCISHDFAHRVLPFRGGLFLYMIIGCNFVLFAMVKQLFISEYLLITEYMVVTLLVVVHIEEVLFKDYLS